MKIVMKHIDALYEYINHALNEKEKAYLIKLLEKENRVDIPVKLGNDVLGRENDSSKAASQSPVAIPLQSEFLTLTKRTVKFGVIKKNILIQKPKTLLKLQNFIKHIGQAEGGFSDAVIHKIIENLTLDHVLIVDESQNVNWLK